ncbi:MAG: phage tail length tape measure family protein [Sulfuritalea sp.]|nr:phage tail length tape measure family protein [Sulfuritalea sp.]
MSDNIKLGLTLTYDGKAVAGGTAANTQQVKQFGDAAKKAGSDAAQSFDRVTLSAKQTSAALRQVPMQFTDIFTSLAAGQNPMQVMLQQGGQLKDMFGGIGPAARAMGGYVAGMINPMTMAGAAVVGLAVAYESGRRESEEMAKSIILSGNAAGTTAGQMQTYARTVAEATGATRGAAAEVMTQLTATGKVSNEMLGRATEAAVRLQRVGGPAIEDTVSRFAELGKAPVAASLKLNEQTNYLTGAVYLQIKALQEQNDIAAAGALAQGAYADAGKKMAAEMEKNLGLMERGWRKVGDAAKKTLDVVKGIGRPESPDDQLAAAQAWLAALQNKQKALGAEVAESDLTQAREAVALARAKVASERDAAKAAADTRDEFEKQKKAIAEADKSATHQVFTLKESLNLLRTQKDAAIKNTPESLRGQVDLDFKRRELELTRQLLDLYHNMGNEGRALDNARIDGALKLSDIRGKADAAHLAAQKQLSQISDSRAFNAQALIEERQLEEQLAAVKARKIGPAPAEKVKRDADIAAIEAQQIAARQATLDKFDLMEDKAGRDSIARDAAIAKERGEVERAYTLDYIAKKQLAMREAYAAGDAQLIAQIQAQFDAGLGNARFTAVKQDYDRLFEQLKAELEAVRQEAERDGGWLAGINAAAKAEEIKSRLMPQLDALGKQLDGLADKSPINQKATATAKRELQTLATEVSPIWKHAVEGIDRTFHDAFSRMLESGKGSWESFAESLKNTFKTTVADAIYQMFARPFVFQAVAGASGAMGFSGAANAFGGAGGMGGGIGDLFSMGSSASSLFGGGSGAYTAFAMSEMGSSLGLSTAYIDALGIGEAVGGTALSALGTALPYVGAALAVASMLGAFDGGGEDPHNNTQLTGFELGLNRSGAFAVQNSDATGAPSAMSAGPTSGEGWWADSVNLSAAQLATISQAVAVTFAQGREAARLLGVDPSVVDSASVDSRYNGTPGNGHIQGYFSTMEQAFAALGDAISLKVIPNLSEFQQSSESLAQTTQRLTQEFVLTNRMATLMGHDAATAFGGTNLKARDALIQSLGGVGGATGVFDNYYKNFHSESERRADTKGTIASTLRALGIADVPATREQFRALVEGQNLATDAGRAMYATLLSVSDAFAGITTSAEAAAKALGTDRFRTRADYLYAQKTGVLPAYASGGDHAGGWAVVGEAGPEIAYMPPSRVYSNSDSKALLDQSQVVRAIETLRADLRADLRAANAALARSAGKTAKTLDKWDVDGMPPERV